MDATLVATWLLSCLIGVTLGIFGGGGSVLAVPVLVLVAHLAPQAAVGASLAIVGSTSLLASFAHYRRGHVRFDVAIPFALSGVLMAFVGARLSALVSGPVLLRLFAALMCLAGGAMFLGQTRVDDDAARRPAERIRPIASIVAGAGAGLATGFLGVGGGFLVVPALVAFAGLPMRAAVGTSLLVIALNSAAGLVGHVGSGQLNFGLVVPLTAAAVLGALVGERFARHVSPGKLKRGFALMVIVVGVTLAFAGGLGATHA